MNASLKTYGQELVVYVVWHPQYVAGREMAGVVYDQLTRDSSAALSRGLGIPVYLWTAETPEGLPRDVPFDEAAHPVVVEAGAAVHFLRGL